LWREKNCGERRTLEHRVNIITANINQPPHTHVNGPVASSSNFPNCSLGAAPFSQYLVRLANESLKTTYKSHDLDLVWNM